MGAAAGDALQFVSVLQLWTTWSFCLELPDATKARSTIKPAEPEAASGSLQTRACALHHP